jgi:hypothetical protein
MQALAIARGEPLETIVARLRPPVVASVEPRPEHRQAFQLEERQRIIDRLKAEAAV